MNQANPLLFAVAIIVGVFFPIQAGLNATLGKGIGNPTFAALLSGVGTVVFVTLYALFARTGLPAVGKLGEAPAWSWAGGLFGACIVLAATLLAPKLGSAVFQALVIGGQLSCSLLLDHKAWLGFQEHPASPLRLLGFGLMLVGVFLIAKF